MTLFGFFSAFKRSSSFFSLYLISFFFFSMKFEKITCPGKWILFALTEKFFDMLCFFFLVIDEVFRPDSLRGGAVRC